MRNAQSIIKEGYEEAQNELSEEEKEARFASVMKKYGHFVKYLTEGDSFGDLGNHFISSTVIKVGVFYESALLEPSSVRSATILCKTSCEFLTLDSVNYNNFVRQTRDLKTQFLNQIFRLGDSVTSSVIKNLIFYSFQVIC